MNSDTSTIELPARVRRRVRGFRVAALVILLTGVVSALTVYWVGSRRENIMDDPSMIGFNKAQDRQMQILYGKQGQLIEDVTGSLKQPGTQAVLIVIGAALVAALCYKISSIEARNAMAEQQGS